MPLRQDALIASILIKQLPGYYPVDNITFYKAIAWRRLLHETRFESNKKDAFLAKNLAGTFDQRSLMCKSQNAER